MADINSLSNAQAKARKEQLLGRKKRLKEELDGVNRDITAVQARIAETKPVGAIGKHAGKKATAGA